MSASSAGLVPVVKALLAKDAIVYALANKNSFSALLAAHRHPECQAVILEHILVKALSDPTILNVVHESASHVTLCNPEIVESCFGLLCCSRFRRQFGGQPHAHCGVANGLVHFRAHDPAER